MTINTKDPRAATRRRYIKARRAYRLASQIREANPHNPALRGALQRRADELLAAYGEYVAVPPRLGPPHEVTLENAIRNSL